MTGRPAMISKIAWKSARCSGSSLASAARRPASSSARIIWRTAEMRAGIEEHVLGAAQADALGAELARHAAIGRGLGIGAHLHAAVPVGPAHQHAEIADQFGLDGRHLAGHDLARWCRRA